MTQKSNNCPLPCNVSGCAFIDTTTECPHFEGYPVVIESGNVPCTSRVPVTFEDFRDGILYASLQD